MHYREKPDFSLGARVEVYLRDTSTEVVVSQRQPTFGCAVALPRNCFRATSRRGMTCRPRVEANRSVCRRVR